MIDLNSIETIVAQYEKFGWSLRRILLKNEVLDRLIDNLSSQFKDIPIHAGVVDGLWFSRRQGKAETWELRRLSGTPFALLDVIDVSIEGPEREAILAEVESRMAESPTNSSGEISLEK
jgi:hypothetical protein